MKLFDNVEDLLKQNKLSYSSKDLNKPWGGFYKINENLSRDFLHIFFDSSFSEKLDFKSKLSPKILIVKPKMRLSWQYHHRRSEIWSVIKGDILVSRSENDNEGDHIKLKAKDQIEIGNKIRHRIVGTNNFALVAEIWIHTDNINPSNENDIVRLQDDFNRN